MKAVFEKARNILGGNQRRTTLVERTASDDAGQVELHNVKPLKLTASPSRGFSSDCATVEGDDVLFSKNNVLLKHPLDVSNNLSISPKCSLSGIKSKKESPSCNSELLDKALDNHILIPGFLFVTTRGSNFGTTLILNWAPNSSMKVPSVGHTEKCMENSPQGATVSSVKSEGRCCSSVSIDLCLMEMIRIFYHVDESGFILSGELVVKSKEEEFKVFYFKNGGLNELVHIFRSWTCFNHTCHKDTNCHTFTVFCPKLSLSELHPLEGTVTTSLTNEAWSSLKDNEGRITDIEYVRKVVFFKGIKSSMRKEVWPFLLDVYSFNVSSQEKEKLQQMYSKKYRGISFERQIYYSTLSAEETFKYDSLHSQIDKDVMRTDRSIAYYNDANVQNLSILLSIILNYLHYKQDIAYVQGMTDLLAPLLSILDDEVEAFWSFTKIMDFSFLCTPGKNQVSIKNQLEILRYLTEMLIPDFYEYLMNTDNGPKLMFCHRWILVFFKREFKPSDTLLIWESCWSGYETKSFHLFICVAIMAIYGQKPMEKYMNVDELMVYFNTLSLQMPREIILSQARGYLNKFCYSKRVNCSLYEIMEGDFWHKKDSPLLFCNICNGFGYCSRTGFLSSREMVC